MLMLMGNPRRITIENIFRTVPYQPIAVMRKYLARNPFRIRASFARYLIDEWFIDMYIKNIQPISACILFVIISFPALCSSVLH